MTESASQLAAPPDTIKRLAFLGTPPEAAVALRALVGAGFDVAPVVTQPDRRRGRGAKLDPSPVKAAAVDLGLEVVHDLDGLAGPASGDAGAQSGLDPAIDLGVVVAYGRIIPRSILRQLPMVNIHFSLLPRWRGAAPVERAILAGDTTTGVCLMEVAEGLDTGGVYARVEVDIDQRETSAQLRARLAECGAQMLVDRLKAGLGRAEPQTGEPTYAAKLERDEFRLDPRRPAVELHRVVRLGRAWITFRGRRLAVMDARPAPGAAAGPTGQLDGPVMATSDGGLELIEVRPEGRRSQSAADWLNGVRPEPGERLV